ncbi:unnamed protein product [Phyllotreta striolata]|uniref:Androgen-dependent TFPI-regulating protein n=1 Tax=Phyllotreta striolata TaxID=444603 RepID=A0A9N9XLN2_PHYSR|nr:unnamed protein product [Phyllotreta striolata]
MTVKNFVPVFLYLGVVFFYFYSVRKMEENQRSLRSDPDRVAKFSNTFRILGKYQGYFFTNWTFVLQILFVCLASLDEISKLIGIPSGIKNLLGKTRAFLFNALLFPCTLTVILTFWGIWYVDRELIFPKEIDEFFPSWMNHVLHSFIGVPLLLETLLPKKDHFIKFKPAAAALLIFCLVYQSLYFSIYFKDGIWLYPVYKVLDWPQRIIFNLIQVVLILGFQYTGLLIQNSKRSIRSKQKAK